MQKDSYCGAFDAQIVTKILSLFLVSLFCPVFSYLALRPVNTSSFDGLLMNDGVIIIG